MADEVTETAAPTTFAQFEAAGGKYNPPAEPAKPEKPAEPAEEPKEAEPEPAEQPEAEQAEKKPAKQKLSLSEERAKLLAEVTELRRERRQLQQPPAAQQPQEAKPEPAANDDKPPVRPRLSTFQGTLEEYEKEVEKYDEENRAYVERQYQRRQAAEQAKTEQQRILAAYGEKLAAHLKEHPDYDAEIDQTPITQVMAELVLHEGPSLGQALIDNKENAKRIANLPRDIQIFEMGRLSAGLNGHAPVEESVETAQPPQPVKVPARLNATGSSSSAMAKPDHGAKSFQQWEEIERRLAKRK